MKRQRGAPICVEVGQVLDDRDAGRKEHVVGRVLLARRPSCPARRCRVRTCSRAGSRSRPPSRRARHQPVAGARAPCRARPSRTSRWPRPPSSASRCAAARCRRACTWPACRSSSAGADLAVVAEVREIDHGGVADPLVDRHRGDVAIVGQEVHGRVDVRVGVAGDRQHRRLEAVAGGVRRRAARARPSSGSAAGSGSSGRRCAWRSAPPAASTATG